MSSFARTRGVSAATLCVLLVAAVWGAGGGSPAALALLCVAAPAALLMASLLAREPSGVGTPCTFRWLTVHAPLAAYLAVQALNASHVYSLQDGGLTLRRHVEWLPSSVDARATVRALFWYGSALCVYALAQRVRSAGGIRLTVVVMTLSAFLAAVWAAIQRGRSPQAGLGVPFANENHLAAWINLVIPPVLGLARHIQLRAAAQGRGSHPGQLLYAVVAVLALAVVASRSRAGIAICALSLLLWSSGFAWQRWRRGGRARRRPGFRGSTLAATVLPAALAIGLAVTFGSGTLREISRKMAVASEPFYEQRLLACRDTLHMVADNPVFGVGAGAFAAAFPFYQSEDLRGFYRYAHNDWLQALSELGLMGVALAALAAGAHAVWFRRGASFPNLPVRAGLKLGLLGLAAHAAVDFPLHIPGVAFLTVTWLAFASAAPGCGSALPVGTGTGTRCGNPDSRLRTDGYGRTSPAPRTDTAREDARPPSLHVNDQYSILFGGRTSS